MHSDYFLYQLHWVNKPTKNFNWKIAFDQILRETNANNPMRLHSSKVTLHVLSVDTSDQSYVAYSGYMRVGEDKKEWGIGKKNDEHELELDDDEILFNKQKGKVFFFLAVFSNKVILVFEKIHFILNISGFVAYLQERFATDIDDLKQKTLPGREFIDIVKRNKEKNIKVADIYFKNYVTKEMMRQFGYVEDVLPKLLAKKIRAEVRLHFIEDTTLKDFLLGFSKKETVDEAIAINYAEVLKIFDLTMCDKNCKPINLIDKILRIVVPFDKGQLDDVKLCKHLEGAFKDKKDLI